MTTDDTKDETPYLTRKEVEEKISYGRHNQLFPPNSQVVLEKLVLKPWQDRMKISWDAYDYQFMDFTEVSMRDAVLILARLHHAVFDKADLTNALANPSLLNNASFKGATLTGMNFAGSDLHHAWFCEAKMQGVQMVGVDARRVDFKGADLTGANLAMSDFYGSSFVGANLTNADLSGSDLSQCNFSEANLTGATFSFARTLGIVLYETIYHPGQFSQASMCEIIHAEKHYDKADEEFGYL